MIYKLQYNFYSQYSIAGKKMLLFNIYITTYILKSGKHLKIFYSNIFYITCLIHKL